MWRIALVVGLALAGCFSANEKTCEDGTVCPGGKVCAPGGGACVDQEQIDACVGVADGGGCQLATIGHGVCHGGLCVAVGGCGDCVVENGEVCDDCNTTSGDGCRADCQKIEMCGDGVVDDGEACDDGNTSPVDGCDMCRTTAWNPTVVVGGNVSGADVVLAQAPVLATDRAGQLYVGDASGNYVYRYDPVLQRLFVIAGNGTIGPTGEGVPATSTSVVGVTAIAVDGLGNVYLADGLSVRRIDVQTGILTRVAGEGLPYSNQCGGVNGDEGPATLAQVHADSIAIDGVGNLYIADSEEHCVREVTSDGVIHSIAGQGSNPPSTTPQPPSDVQLSSFLSIAVDAQNSLYIGYQGGVLELSSAGIVRIAGTDPYGTDAGDGGPAIDATLSQSLTIAVAPNDDVYVAELTSTSAVRVIHHATLTIDHVAGNAQGVSSGDGGPAATAGLALPRAIAADMSGHLWIGTTGTTGEGLVRVIHGGTIDRAIGEPNGYSLGGHPATSVNLASTAVTIDPQGRAVVGIGDQIVRFDASGATVIAGNPAATTLGDGGPATSAMLQGIQDLAYDAQGTLYVGESGFSSGRVRKIDSSGTISTLATGFSYLQSIAVGGTDVYVGDEGAHAVYRVSSDGTVHSFAGTGNVGPSTSGNALSVPVNTPRGLATDANGNVYIADTLNSAVDRIDSTGALFVLVGTSGSGYSGDGGLATQGQVEEPEGVAVAPDGTLYIVDSGNSRLRTVDSNLVLHTIAGTGAEFSGDHGPASTAGLGHLHRLAFDPSGAYDVIDVYYQHPHLRHIDTGGTITTIAGIVWPAGLGAIANASPADPSALVLTPAGTLIAGGSSGTVERLTSSALDVVSGRYLQQDPTGQLARYRSSLYPDVNGIAFDGASTLYVSAGNAVDAVTMTTPDPDTWTLATFQGDYTSSGYGTGTGTTYAAPMGLAVSGSTLYVADSANHLVRAVTIPGGDSQPFAGTARTLGFAGDGGAPTDALLFRPTAVAVCGSNIYIADTGNNRVRRVANNQITTILGDGVAASAGQGAPSALASVDSPRGLACDAAGNLYVTSRTTVRVLAADANGDVDGTGPVETIFGEPPRDTFPASVTRCLAGVVVVDDNTVRVSDSCTGMLIDLVRVTQ